MDTNEEFLHAAWDAAIEGATAPIDFSKGGFYEPETFFDLIRKDHSIIEIDSLQKADAVDLGLRQIPSFTRESPAVGWLQDQQSQGMRIVIVARGHGTAERIVDILSCEQLPVVLTEVLGDPASEHITCVVGNLDSGFVMQDQKLIVLSETEFFGVSGAYASPKERKLARRRGQQVDPLALKAGDYVVHEIHGIGRFKELIQRQNRNQVREYLLIEYAPPKRGYPADTLFVPTDQLDFLSRYVGAEAPVLSKMGGTDWARAKGNARKAVRKIAIDLVKLYSARMKSKGYAFGPDTNWQKDIDLITR